jgi:Na+/H+ antiporter NhaD/arsenite permease-like protein
MASEGLKTEIRVQDTYTEGEFELKTAAIILFVAMYVVMIVRPKWRTLAALITGAIFLITGILPVRSVFNEIDWNVILMIAGTMVVVDYFIESKMPNRIADILLDKADNVMWVTIYMSLFAGVISAFIDNVATVLMVAPVGLAVCRKLKISPVGMLISIAVSSNLQGAATLVGDTTSIMLGAYARMDFTSFFFMKGRPGIFWAVELGALATIPVLMLLFRKQKEPVHADEMTKVSDFVPSFMLLGVVAALITASFIPGKPDITNGLICCCMAGVSILYDLIRTKKTKGLVRALKGIDFSTIYLLIGLFTVIGGIKAVGIIDDVAAAISRIGGSSLFLLYTVVVFGSVAISAFIDNIPYVATMLPVMQGVSAMLGIEPYLLYFGLLTGATLGGNLTPVGASANITAIGILEKNGERVSFGDFARIGVPLTLTAVLAGYLFIWVVWH